MTRLLPLLLVVLVACGLSWRSAARSPTPLLAPSEVHPVTKFFLEGIDAFNRHDLQGFMEQFGEEIEMYTPSGWLRGRTAVQERFASTFAQLPQVRMEVDDLRVREVVPGTAVTDFRWRVYPAGSGPAYHGIGTGVYILRDGVWQEVLEHETLTHVDEGLPGS